MCWKLKHQIKNKVIQDSTGKLFALRYGEEWRDCIGDGLILTLAQDIEKLKEENKNLRVIIERFMEKGSLNFSRTKINFSS